MREVSAEFLEAMKKRPCIAKIVLDGVDTIEGSPVQSITFTGGSNGEADAISIGSVVAASVEIVLDKTLIDFYFAGRSMEVSLGMKINGEMEWVEMGTYIATEPEEDDGSITVTGMDAIGAYFDVEYEPIEGFDPASEEGVSAKAFAAAICARHGVVADLSDLEDHMLTHFSPEGLTDRKLVGLIAAFYGKFANIGRDGILRFRWYQAVDVKITGNEYYDGEMIKSSYDFHVFWLKCYNEVLEETLTEGYADADQGIYFACPWMTQERLAALWATLGGFDYAPVSELSFFGDPRLEPGDMIRLANLLGEMYDLPIMSITHEFDGGLKTTVSSVGQRKSDAYEGPVQRETKRTIAKIMKTQKGIEMSVENTQNEISRLQLLGEGIFTRVEGVEGSVSELEQKAASLEAEVADAAENVANLQIQADEITGKVENFEEELTEVKQTAGHVSVKATDEDGTLETQINPTQWTAQRTDANGNVTSGFRFDFGTGMFVFDGTGKFMAPDGKSYITVDGGAFVMHAQDGNSGKFVELARIGFSEDSDGTDFPYILLGNAANAAIDMDSVGLIKMFSNGIYIGNAAPRESTGNFVGLRDSAGFFVNVKDRRIYSVSGEVMMDVFTAVFA